ncbi:hypothetical protein [Pelosinus sp. IPA-1]|uniref:hypothetical protein n=1 Tax=Pelosinus sp. IPA-1 TaxID=3029569 RepID=UPI0024361DDE|nr:hypothetical protein [Pelosinus sp. IPA-1]GMA99461.1 hypothetical protein PIPA1_22610 [Pelosinus sp. IPA-1]
MDVFVDENGCWKIRGESTGLDYEKVLIEYLGIIHPLFCQAKEISEFDYLQTLLGIRSMEDAGWNPFKSTTRPSC